MRSVISHHKTISRFWAFLLERKLITHTLRSNQKQQLVQITICTNFETKICCFLWKPNLTYEVCIQFIKFVGVSGWRNKQNKKTHWVHISSCFVSISFFAKKRGSRVGHAILDTCTFYPRKTKVLPRLLKVKRPICQYQFTKSILQSLVYSAQILILEIRFFFPTLTFFSGSGKSV